MRFFGSFNIPHVNEYFEMQDFLLDNCVIFMYHEYGLDSWWRLPTHNSSNINIKTIDSSGKFPWRYVKLNNMYEIFD